MNWLMNGFTDASTWQIVIFTLIVTHVTMISVTVFLHRHQAHRALDLHPIPSHFFRCWLWLTTGQVTKEWVSVHRKHHAKCETEEDPHSPQTRGIRKVLFEGAELYRTESKNLETLNKYGTNTPNDWIEKNVYTRYSMMGVVLMLGIDVALFGVIGITVWAIQMAWTPIMAAGVINGIGHFWGYRNFETTDAATNISPWGILIAGEELHNNHHTYPTSAKLSVKSYEFDIGWMYIRILSALGLATVRKIPPQIELGSYNPEVSTATLRTLVDNRFAVMAIYGRAIRKTCALEMSRLGITSEERTLLSLARKWLYRNPERIPVAIKTQLEKLENPTVTKLAAMRDRLQMLWLERQANNQELVERFNAWCREAQTSNIEALQMIARQIQSMQPSLQK
jgi:stearoyl-CoA desaturase (delta-9 desaturase)